ncbi:g5206 [Coccomyxa elongata]
MVCQPSLQLPFEIDAVLGGAAAVRISQQCPAQRSTEEAGALTPGDLFPKKESLLNRKAASWDSSDSTVSPRSLLHPQPSLASAGSDASDRPSLPCRQQVSAEECKSHQAAAERGGKCNAPGNASERLRMVITDSDALQRKIREHLYLTQGRHMASSVEPADVYNRPASLDSHVRLRSMDSQIRRAGGTNGQIGRVTPDGLTRRASLDGAVSAQIGNAAVIRARNSSMPSCIRAALPPLATAAAKAALGLPGAGLPTGTDASCQVGGAVNAKMVSRSLVEDMMVPLNSLERSISDLINEA